MCPEGAGPGRVRDLAAPDWRVPARSAAAGDFGCVGGGGPGSSSWAPPATEPGGQARRVLKLLSPDLPSGRLCPSRRCEEDGPAPAAAAPPAAGLRRRRPLPLLRLAPRLPGQQGAAQEGPAAPPAALRPRRAWREAPQVCKFHVGLGWGSSCGADSPRRSSGAGGSPGPRARWGSRFPALPVFFFFKATRFDPVWIL